MEGIISKPAIFCQLLGWDLVMLMILYLTGCLVTGLLGIRIASVRARTFIRLMTGLITIVFLTALWFTKGQTIMLGLLLPSLYILFEWRRSPGAKLKGAWTISREDLSALAKGMIPLLAILCFRFLFWNEHYGLTINYYTDVVFYQKLSHYLDIMGRESISMEYFLGGGPSPYHYLELWLNVFFTKITGINHTNVLIGGTYTTLAILVFFGFHAIAGQFEKTRTTNILFSLVFLFFGCFYLPSLQELPFLKFGNSYAHSIMAVPKLSVILVFLQLALLVYLKRGNRPAIFILLYLPVVYFTSAPAVYFALTVMALIMLVKGAKIRWTGPEVTASLTVVLFIGLFYLVGGIGDPGFSGSAVSGLLHNIASVDFYFKIVSVLVGSATLYLLLLSPVVALAFINRRILLAYFKETREVLSTMLIFVTMLLLGGLLAWALLYYGLTTIQFFSNISIPLFSLITFLLVIIVIHKSEHAWQKAMAWFMVMVVTASNLFFNAKTNRDTNIHLALPVSGAFLERFRETTERYNPIGASFRAPEDYRDMSIHHIVESTYSMDRTYGTLGMDIDFHTVSLTSDLIDPAAFGTQQQLVADMVGTIDFHAL